LQKREVVCWVEECCAARWAAGRNDRYWVGESETAGWYDRTGEALLGCAVGWERGG
jgi:hypothetical protein